MLFSSDKGFHIIDGVLPENHGLFIRDPYLFWRFKPNPTDKFHMINLQGFRGEEINLEKPKNTYRIFCIGDSCTFGFLAKYDEAYPFFLEKLLNQASHGIKYEVVNAGVFGYSSLQGLRHLERDYLKYKPDLVIASFGWNDTFAAIFYTDKEQKMPNSNKIMLLIDSFLSRFKIYLLMDHAIWSLRYRIRSFYIHKKTGTQEEFVRVPEKDFIDNLNEIHELGSRNNFKVIFLNQPNRISGAHRYDGIIRELCKQKGFFFLDLLDKFNTSHKPVSELFIDGNHTTAEGNSIIAESIFEYLRKETIIKNNI